MPTLVNWTPVTKIDDTEGATLEKELVLELLSQIYPGSRELLQKGHLYMKNIKKLLKTASFFSALGPTWQP